MSKVHGKETVIQIGEDDISQYCNASTFAPTTDTHDNTTYGSDGHVYDGGLTDGKFTVGGKYDSTAGTGPRAVLLPLKGTAAKVEITRQIEGAGSSLPQDVFDGVCEKYEESAPVADYIMWTAEFQISGDVDSTAQSA